MTLGSADGSQARVMLLIEANDAGANTASKDESAMPNEACLIQPERPIQHIAATQAAHNPCQTRSVWIGAGQNPGLGKTSREGLHPKGAKIEAIARLRAFKTASLAERLGGASPTPGGRPLS